MKKLISLFLAVTMIAGLCSAFTFSAFAADVISVSSWDTFASAMKTSGTATIKLTKDIQCSHKMGSDGHTTLVMAGDKTLDLNGYSIGCKDESNAKDHGFKVNKSHWFTTCYSTEGNKKTLIEIPSGATLTIDDKSGKTGKVFFTGKTVGLTFDAYYDKKHYNGYTTRDLFDVKGTLTINNGTFAPGNTSEYWVSNGVNFDEWGSKIYVHFTNHAHEQIFGSVASVGSGGKLIVNGGNLSGQGIEATVKDGIAKPGNMLDWLDGFDSLEESFDTIMDVGEDLGVLESDESEYVNVLKRDEIIELKGGNVEVNGGIFNAMNGANVFGGTADGKVKINAGRFTFDSKSYLRVIDYEYNSGKYYGTVIKGRKGAFGAKADAFDLNKVFIATDGNTYTDAEAIKSLEIEKRDGTIVVGEKEIAKKELTFVGVKPEVYDINKEAAFYDADYGETVDYTFNILPLTAEEKAAGYTVKKSIIIRGEEPGNANVNIQKTSTTDEAVTYAHKFDKRGWYEVIFSAYVYDGSKNKVGHKSYTYKLIVNSVCESIEVTTNPTKTVYEVGEKIDATGMVVTAAKNDGTTSDVTRWVTVLQDDAVRPGQTYFVVEYVPVPEKPDKKFITYVPITVKEEAKPEEPKAEEPKPEEPKKEEPKKELPAITIENIFIDVKEADWFYNDVLLAVQLGLVNGKSANEYKPNDNLTYAEAIKLAACMHQLYTEGAIKFGKGDPWYQPYVDYCVANKIIDQTYNYTENATRAGYMTIFAKALPDEALKAVNRVPDNSIPDVPMGESYSQGIYKLYRAGILQGSDAEHNCKPFDNIKRSEVAAIIARMMFEAKRISFSMGSNDLTIKTQPGTKTAEPGTTVEFSVEVEGGKEPYTYQWMHEVGGAKKQVVPIPNETAATIVRTAPSENGSTKCHCVITDANGDTVTSEEAVLTGKESTGGVKDKFQQAEETAPLTKEDFLLYVEDVFTVSGRGVVASGRVAFGKLEKGDAITIIAQDGTKKQATVAGIEMFRKSLDEAEKGDNIGLNFSAEIEKGMVERGDCIVSASSTHTVSTSAKGTLKLITQEDGGRASAISDGFKPQFYRTGMDFTGVITGLANGTMNPGETQENIIVEFPAYCGVFYIGQELSVRQAGRTIGTFTITNK